MLSPSPVWQQPGTEHFTTCARSPSVFRRRHRLHFFLYDGANDGTYAPQARAFVRRLARYGVPYYWDSRVTEPTGILYHTWIYWRNSGRDALIRLSALFVAERAQA